MSDIAEKKARLEELRKELRAERISYGELSELQSLKQYINKDDVELLEAIGEPEEEERNNNWYEARFILADYKKGRDITEALEELIKRLDVNWDKEEQE